MWKDYIDFFSEKYRVITIDLLGHGESEPLGYVHEMEDNANAINEVLENLKIEKATIVGHSMGGYVGLAFAELYPKKIQKLLNNLVSGYFDFAEIQAMKRKPM